MAQRALAPKGHYAAREFKISLQGSRDRAPPRGSAAFAAAPGIVTKAFSQGFEGTTETGRRAATPHTRTTHRPTHRNPLNIQPGYESDSEMHGWM